MSSGRGGGGALREPAREHWGSQPRGARASVLLPQLRRARELTSRFSPSFLLAFFSAPDEKNREK